MTKGKKRPGERRRVKKRRRQKKAAADFRRPIEWAESELQGVRDWLLRLQGHLGARYPAGWRRGQISHYKKRAVTLRAEIKASKAEADALKSEGDNGPNVA